MASTTKGQTQFRGARFIAVDRTNSDKVIAEGKTAQATVRKAERTGRPFTMAFVPPSGKKYIF